ncbi:MAG: SUMF1/EgtB/PvdO family nonheme iron enzyme [Treponema sp.]|nr:SUMF1/EgtB/PvdO family nonheme iron enzyme [Treponema sp.]
MKKFFVGVVSMLVLGFAQAESYEELFAQGKAYEAEGQWIHALSSYWDAMEAEMSEKACDAYIAYGNIAYALRTGNPGLGDYSSFGDDEMKAGWKKIQAEYETFWTEHSPRQFEFAKISQVMIDSVTKSSAYSTFLKWTWLPKYEDMADILTTGYDKVRTTAWSDMVTSWPKYAATIGEGVEGSERGDRNLSSTHKPTNFSVDFFITDSEGNVLLEKATVRASETFSFSQVSDEAREAFRSGRVRIVPRAVHLVKKSSPVSLENVFIKTPYDDLEIKKNVLVYMQDISKVAAFSSDFPRMMDMVQLPRGSFMMGTTKGTPNQKPVHRVNVLAFKMGSTEVTQELYEYVMEMNPSLHKGKKKPVQSVSWFDAIYFCNKLSMIAGLTPCYTVDGVSDIEKWEYKPGSKEAIDGFVACNFRANGFRLPTEAEWEYAASGCGKGETQYAGSSELSDVAWYGNGKSFQPMDVGTKKANSAGMYDMSGNVFEWVWDWFSKYTASEQTNTKGADSGVVRVYRGGGYLSLSGACMITYRISKAPQKSDLFLGFRIAQSVEEVPKPKSE